MKNDFERKLTKKTEDIKTAISGIALDAKSEANRTAKKVSTVAKDADKKVDKAGNEMKATLQQMKKDIKQVPKKADKKNRK